MLSSGLGLSNQFIMVRIIPNRLRANGGNTPGGSRSSSPSPAMHKRDLSPGVPGTKANGLVLRIVVLRVRAVEKAGYFYSRADILRSQARNLAAKDKSGTSDPVSRGGSKGSRGWSSKQAANIMAVPRPDPWRLKEYHSLCSENT